MKYSAILRNGLPTTALAMMPLIQPVVRVASEVVSEVDSADSISTIWAVDLAIYLI